MSSAGQGSISMSQKNEPAGSPGPPFLPTSADNGLSVDAITGKIVFGDDIGGLLAMFLSPREIEMNGNLFQFLDGGNRKFLIDPVFPQSYLFGDIDGAQNATHLEIFDAVERVIISSNTASNMLLLDAQQKKYELGEDGGAAKLAIDYSVLPGTVVIRDAVELMFAMGNQVYSMGNVNDTLLGSKISVDDLNEGFTFSSIAKGRMLTLLGSIENYTIGDNDGLNNGTLLNVDDSAGNTRVEINALNGLTITQDTILLHTGTTLANGAGAALGTLTNAPTVGDPTKWIPIDDNGTIRYVPSWT